jgi:DNA repair protein RecN (Recombination protein N)
VLTELRVRDLGVIEDLTLSFAAGMTVLTGETGAGKTLLVEALQLVLGGRANPSMVRAGATEAVIEARFDLGQDAATDADGTEVIITRSVPANGRSRAWVNGRMTPVSALNETVAELVEIHGQHEHRSLTTANAQRAVLDAYAGTDLSPLAALRVRLRALQTELADLGGDEQQRAREADVLRYQVEEIAAAHLDDPDEDAALQLEEERLADSTAYREAAAQALGALDAAAESESAGALDLLGEAAAALAGRAAFDEYRERVAAAAIDITDVARSLRDEVEGWEDDPARLPEVQERRRRLGELRRKYGEDLAAVMAFAKQAATRLHALEDAEGTAARLEAERVTLGADLTEAEAVVREHRSRHAASFGQLVGERLSDLAMAGARIEVRVGAEGTGEPIEIALGANVGEAVLPLAKAASGGELARAMLAIRLVGSGGPPTMVFDEVDAGVGCAAALALAAALHEVGQARQVLVVTHLAQVAARADHQISVVKQEAGGRTVTTALVVTGEERVAEVSRMLSGHPDSDAARAHARELLGVDRGSGA